jgi:hypothetical protein
VGAQPVTIANIPSLERFQVIPNGKSQLIEECTWAGTTATKLSSMTYMAI